MSQDIMKRAAVAVSLFLDSLMTNNFERAADDLLELGKLSRDDAIDRLRRNRNAYSRHAGTVLGNRDGWLILNEEADEPRVLAFAGLTDPAFDFDGYPIHLREDGARLSMPNDSVRHVFAQLPVSDACRELEEASGLSAHVWREALRLGAEPKKWKGPRPASAIEAFLKLRWQKYMAYSTDEFEDEDEDDVDGKPELYIYGMQFRDPGHVPEGFSHAPETVPIGYDAYKFYALAPDDDCPGDPMVVFVDHEEEDQSPVAETFLSAFLNALNEDEMFDGDYDEA